MKEIIRTNCYSLSRDESLAVVTDLRTLESVRVDCESSVRRLLDMGSDEFNDVVLELFNI